MSDRRAISIAAGGMIALAAAMGIGRFVYTPILPFMEAALGLSKSDTGLIATANFAGYLAGALLAGLPVLSENRRAWFIGMLAISVLPTGLMGMTTTLEYFLALRFAGGFSSAFVLVFGSALVLETLARYQRPALSALHFGGVGLGIAFSAILVARIDAAGFGWQAHWLACALATAVATLVVAMLVKADDDRPVVTAATKSGTPSGRATAPSQSSSSLKALVVAYGLFGFGYIITATFISTMVRTDPEVRFLEPYIWMLVGVAGVPSVFVWTAISNKLGTATGFALACLIEAIAVVISVLGTGPISMILAALLLGGTFMGITALGLIRAREFSQGANQQDPRKLLGLMTVAFSIGQMVGPTFAGYTWSFGNSFLLPSMAAATALLIAAALTGLSRKSAN